MEIIAPPRDRTLTQERLDPRTIRSDNRLIIHEVYVSVQGESTYAGLPCVFIRTTGCPLRCSWCDTEHAFFEGKARPIDDLLGQVLTYDVNLVEVTGGEPLVQKNIHKLIAALCDAGKTVLIETSGAYDISPIDPRAIAIMDIKCPDSGEAERNLWSNIEALRPHDEIKFVLASRHDYEFARDTVRTHRLGQRFKVLFSTVFGRLEAKEVVGWMLDDKLHVRFQLQMHKYVWPADQRGV